MKLTKSYLNQYASSIEWAKNGLEGCEMYQQDRFDLIFMDLQMPIMDGIMATMKIRELEKELNVYTPIVALTAQAEKYDKEKCLAVGMDYYLTKPLYKDQLETAISIVLQRDQVR
ncbi:MAG: response regulator [Candidatus Cloacimonetes bacterium]|nr:response regulator [Candidatus Cloacimonadota bacterium]